MKIGFVGLGKMGGNMALRLTIGSPDKTVPGGHEVVGFAKDPNPDLAGVPGVEVVSDLGQMVDQLPGPKVVWVMVPAGKATEGVITDLAEKMTAGDVVIDGGNSYYKDSVRRAHGLSSRGIGFLDVGTSGGVWGRAEGYCMMVGGEESVVDTCKPILDTLAPPDGWARMGGAGAGHYVKMVHNGIEYGMMQAYAEGFEVLHKSDYKLDLEADLQGVEPRQRGPQLAVGTGRAGVDQGGRPQVGRPVRGRQRRGPVDAPGGDGQRRGHAGAGRQPVRPLRQP